MAPNRVFALAAVCLNGVAAGSMDSRKGKAMVTPAPVRNVLRERCFFVMNAMSAASRGVFTPHLFRSLLNFHLFLERLTLNDSKKQRRKLIIILGRSPHDRANGRHVVVLRGASQSISQKFLSRGRDEHLTPRQQRAPEIGDTSQFCAVHELAGSVDGSLSIEV